MKNKGFTLIELLGVIIILSLLMGIALPKIINSIKSANNKVDEITMKLISNATQLYMDSKEEEFPKTNGNRFCVSLQELVDTGYLKGPIKSLNKTDITSIKTVQAIYTDIFNYELVNNDACIDGNDYLPNNGQISLQNVKSDNILNYRIYGNSKQSKIQYGAVFNNATTLTPRIPIYWSNIAKIKLVAKQTPLSQNILLCTYNSSWIGTTDGTSWSFNNGVTGTADKTYTEFANGEVNDVTFEVTSTTNTDYLTIVWDSTWSKARTIYRVTFWNSSNEIIADIECMENGKFYNHTTSSYLSNYENGFPLANVTTNIFNVENYENITPTPEAPIDVVSLGETSKNLFDKSTATENLAVNDNNGNVFSSSNHYASDFIHINPDKKYYMTNSVNGQVLYSQWLAYYDENKIYVSGHNGYGQLQIPINAKYVRATIVKTAIDMFQLEEGSTATDYKPYRYIDVNVSGKNLLDETNNLATANSGYRKIYGLENKPITYSLTVSLKENDVRTNPSVSVYCYYTDGTRTIISTALNVATIYTPTRYSVTITPDTSKTIDYIEFRQCDYISINNGQVPNATNEMIEYNSNATNYESYQTPITTTIDLTGHEPLRKIGNVSDYIDYENSRIVRNIGKVVSDGTENYIKADTATFGMISSKIVPKGLNIFFNYTNSYCTHADLGSEMYLTWYSNPTNNQLEFRQVVSNWGISDYTVEAWKTWLSQQYANGTPVTLYYQLETPTYEDIILPKIKLLRGVSNISFGNGVIPSKLVFNY